MRKLIASIFALTFLTSNSFTDITFWTTEVQPARMEKQMEMAKSFGPKLELKLKLYRLRKKIWDPELLQLQPQVTFRCNLSHTSICFTLGRGRYT